MHACMQDSEQTKHASCAADNDKDRKLLALLDPAQRLRNQPVVHPLQSLTRSCINLNHAVHGGLADIGFGDLHAEYKHTNRHEQYEANQLTSVSGATTSIYCKPTQTIHEYCMPAGCTQIFEHSCESDSPSPLGNIACIVLHIVLT